MHRKYVVLFAALLLAVLLPTPAFADSFVVNSTDDNNDGQCDGTHCSLREAINAANNNPGADSISFAGLDATGGDVTIQLLAPLPPLLDNETTIDGTTVQGYVNEPVINIVKASGVMEDGFAIQSSNNVIRGLSLAGFGGWPSQPDPEPADTTGGAIVITGSGNLIQENVLGWGAWPNTVGVLLSGGGNSVAWNVISGNGAGIYMLGAGQVILGNKIGTDASGNTAIPNTTGIYDAPTSGGSHIIGGSGSGEGNVISGNQHFGIYLQSANNVVQGNYIGTNASGTAALPNGNGIQLDSAINNLIGGSSPGEGNLISGNVRGLSFFPASQGTLVLGNKIGSNASGTSAIPNNPQGVGAYVGSSGITFGGINPGEGNLILGNGTGLRLDHGVNDNAVIGNTITQNNGYGILRKFPDQGSHGFTFSRNSIFENSSLGIVIYNWAPVVPSLAPPQLISASKTSISGTACPYCLVEVFVADPDPSGAGEGKTYLTSVSADANGLFTASFPAVGFCQSLTATSTNSLDNTSEFALNIMGNCIYAQPPLLYPLWVFIITVFGIFGILIRRRRPDGSRWIIPGSLAVGALVGGGMILLAGALPNVIVDFTPEQTVPYHVELPDCVSYLDPSGFSPQDGTTLEIADDVLFEWTPTGDLPDGDIRWTVDLNELEMMASMQTTEGTSLPMSAFGMTPTAGSNFEWSLYGERLLPDGETWLPFCAPDQPWAFSIEQEVSEEPETDEGESEEPVCTTPLITAMMNLTCRKGPDQAYEEAGYLLQGETAIPEGVSMDTFWYWIPNPDWLGYCFVAGNGVQAECVDGLPPIAAPPLPTATPTQAACLPTLDRSACNDAGGIWEVATSTCICP
jgi:CSLREA domain-containing protein